MSIQPIYTEQNPFETDLIAGQNQDIGEVRVWNDETYLYLKYEIDPNFAGTWDLTKTHVDFSSLDGVPVTSKGNPKVGKFDFQKSHDPAVDEYTYEFKLADLGGLTLGETVDIAAHADVQEFIGYADPDLDAFAATLPDSVTMVVQNPGTGFGDPSYFDVDISGGTILDGKYDDFCIDTDRFIAIP